MEQFSAGTISKGKSTAFGSNIFGRKCFYRIFLPLLKKVFQTSAVTVIFYDFRKRSYKIGSTALIMVTLYRSKEPLELEGYSINGTSPSKVIMSPRGT